MRAASGAAISFRLTERGRKLAHVYGTVGDDTVVGYDGQDDYLFGGPQYNTLGGDGAGRDTLYGYGGNDDLYGGINADKLYGGAGNDYLSGGYDNDTYYFSGSFGQDAVYDYYDTNTLLFSDLAQNQVTFSYDGGDLFIEKVGTTDRVAVIDYEYYSSYFTIQFTDGVWDPNPDPNFGATEGADTITGTTGPDTILALGGNDTVNAGYGADKVYGGLGNDRLYGNQDDDFLGGTDGNDWVDGGAGRDLVRGGPGKDTLTGGPDADLFDYDQASDSRVGSSYRDLIRDFARGTDDIELSGMDANVGRSGDQAFTFIGTKAFTAAGQLRAFASNGHTFVQGSNDGDTAAEFEIDLNGTYTLAASDFIL
jgi:Ca2+-binding RTX toxin-like protein